MSRTLTLLAALALAGPAAAAEPALSGTYSSIVRDPDTGERDGVRILLRADQPQPWLEFTLCEGDCQTSVSGPVTLQGQAIAFTVTEEWLNPGGRTHWRPTYRFEGRFVDGGLVLERSDRPGFTLQTLRRTGPAR